MPKALVVKRVGLGHGNHKKPFRVWLNEQKRSELTYAENILRRDETGWTTEDFVLESRARGLDTRIMTVYKWARGKKPRFMNENALRQKFPTVKF